MADLPEGRVSCEPPFSYCGVDLFGPFYVKEGRKELKRYGVVFTCLSSRATHLEVASSMNTDSFINAFRRFVARRGPVRQMRSDQGTNFVGALNEFNAEEAEQRLKRYNCEWLMNPPAASHMGGAWERTIRSVRSILNNILFHHGGKLDDEMLHTFMTEAECIMNSRPLHVEDLNSPVPEPLTPNHLLTGKSKVVLPPPGCFQKEDQYSRKRWRRVQYLVDQFWCRWRAGYIQSLQVRNKWVKPERNLGVGDIVVICDDNAPRNDWRLAKVVEVFPSADNLVRKVKVIMGDRQWDENGKRRKPYVCLERPVHKLVLLVPGH